MHLPTTLYERAPHYWIFVGMLLVVLGLYLGAELSQTFTLFGVTAGLASCAWGIFIFVRRSRRDKSDAGASTITSD